MGPEPKSLNSLHASSHEVVFLQVWSPDQEHHHQLRIVRNANVQVPSNQLSSQALQAFGLCQNQCAQAASPASLAGELALILEPLPRAAASPPNKDFLRGLALN